MSASPALEVLVDADNVFPVRLQPVLDLVGVQRLSYRILAAGQQRALDRLRWPTGTELRPAAGWQQADVVLASGYSPGRGPLLLITGDGDFGLLAARHPGPVLVISGSPSGRLREAVAVLDPAVEGLAPVQDWLTAVGSVPPPPLYTPRLMLRARQAPDSAAFDELFADPEMLRQVADGGPISHSAEEHAKSQDRDIRMQQQLGFSLFTVVRRSDERVLGFTGLAPWPGSDEIEIGWRYRRQFWGAGYASEAARAALGYGLSVVGLPRIISVGYSDNTASLRVMAKIGMHREAEIELHGRTAYRYAIGASANQRSGARLPT